MQLSRQGKNALFTYANDVNAICTPFLQKTPISYFDYHCYYNDGYGSCLTNHPIFIERFFTESLYPKLSQNKIALQLAGQWVFVSDHMPLPTDNNKDNQKKFLLLSQRAIALHIYHRTYFIRQFDDRFIISGFGIPEDNPNVFEFYLNNLDKLESFVNHFEHIAQQLIYGTARNMIYLPDYNDNHSVINTDNPSTIFPLDNLSTNGNKKIINKGRIVTLSQRQLDCLTHHIMGYSTKMSAEKLNISHRTVERHLELAREKIGCHHKRTLRTLLRNNGIIF